MKKNEMIMMGMLHAFQPQNNEKKTEHKCPDCPSNLVLTEPNIIHNDPPRQRVRCLECDYRGFIPCDQYLQGTNIKPSIAKFDFGSLDNNTRKTDSTKEGESDS